jgi:hypothetical protein
MPRKVLSILHELLTSQVFILAAAIVLFLILITLGGPGTSEAVIGAWWV